MMGRERSRPLRPDWEEVKDGIMRQAVLRKFETHADNREVLLATSDELIGNAFPSLPATRASAGFQQPSSPTEHPCSGQTHCFRNLQAGLLTNSGLTAPPPKYTRLPSAPRCHIRRRTADTVTRRNVLHYPIAYHFSRYLATRKPFLEGNECLFIFHHV